METPEQDRLRERLENPPPDHEGNRVEVVDAHASWGPGAANLTTEQRAAIINNVLDQAEKQDRERVSVRLADLRIVYKAMRQAIRLGQSTAEEFIAASPEVRKLKSEIFQALDMALLHAGQMLPREERDKIRDDAERPTVSR